MSLLITGLFVDTNKAGEAISELKQKGYTDSISFVAKDENGEVSTETVKNDPTDGAATGAGIGALAGAVTGVVAAMLPGAPIILAGPLAVTWGVTGTAVGALSGGIVGALVDVGLDQDIAQEFETRIWRVDILVAVTADEDRKEEVSAILTRHGVEQMTEMLEV
ncbi:hypothetical protein LRY65_01950 [Candidatus Woesebacteria bacterium]|nr:hypothetical protein [Candidatus Woesebacteria bacterium]